MQNNNRKYVDNTERDAYELQDRIRERQAKQAAKHYNVFEAAGAAAFGAMAAKFLFGRRGS